jgi:hypothetical protein
MTTTDNLIARLREHCVTTCANYPSEAWKDIREAAAALTAYEHWREWLRAWWDFLRCRNWEE